MDAHRYSQIEKVFSKCCDLPPDDRDAYLDDVCGDDDELRVAVENLLRHDSHTQGLLDSGKAGAKAVAASALSDDESDSHPETIGPYSVVRKLGAGGMGVVYLAEQDQPRRSVAVKVLRPTLISRETRRRFELEAQVLGKLQHPGIAHIYDAGTIGNGQQRLSYFAMEYVDGVPLTEFVSKRKLGTRDILELMARICDAVHHAHQKGVIHRDLKPGNILVDNTGQPKILDFGVARATDADIQAATMQTDVGQLIGTIPYMSPEQVTGISSDIDTRSDVYALGAVTFELLAQKLPLDLRYRSIPEAARMIQEDEPTRLGTINTSLRGEIEVIVAKALEKDRNRRYQSAAEFAEDIRRYLRDEPITARPTTLIYQLRKLSKRHRGFVVGCTLAVAILIVGTILTTAFALKANFEAAKATAVSDFLINDLLESADTYLGRGRDVTVAEVAELSVANLDDAFAEMPAVRASLRGTLGRVLMRLGKFEVAEDQVRAAWQWNKLEFGPDNPQTLKLQTLLGLTLHFGGKDPEAREILEDALNRQRKIDPSGIGEADALAAVGQLNYAMQELDQAESMFRDAHKLYETHLGAESPEAVDLLEQIGDALYNKRKLTDALDLYEQVLALQTACYGEEHFKTSVAQHNLATCLSMLGETEKSEKIFDKAIATRKIVLGEDHPDYADTLYQFARLRMRQQQPEESVRILRQVVAIQRQAYQGDHQALARAMSLLATLTSSLGNHEEALALYDEAYPMYCRVRGPESSAAAKVREGMAYVLYEHGSYEKSLEAVNEAFDLHTKAKSGKPKAYGRLQMCRGLCMMKLGRLQEAKKYLLKAYSILKAEFGDEHRSTQRAGNALKEIGVEIS